MNKLWRSETSVGGFEGIAWLARYLNFRVLCMKDNPCNGKRIFQNIESSSHLNNKLHVRSANACRIHRKWQRHRTLIGKHSLLTLTYNINIFVIWRSMCFRIIIHRLFTEWDASVIKRRKDILSEIKCNQRVAGRLDFWLKDQYLALFSRLFF